MNLAYGVLTTYLAPLKEIVERSSLHRQEAARLVAQALLIKATLSVHREGPKRAASSGKQAEIYSRESGDVPLRLAILKRLAWMYACDKQDKRALEAVLQAQSLLEEQQNKGKPIHPFVRSRVLGGVAEYHALNGKDEEALGAFSEARDAFFASEHADDDEATAADFNYSGLLLEDGLTYYYLEQYEQALDVFAQAIDPHTLTSNVPASSERIRIELLNHATLASLKSPQKNRELSIYLWTAGMQGALALRSEQRLTETLEALSIMQALWSGDKRIKALREMITHW